MKVTGSLQEKNGIYQMIVRVPDINGNLKQKSKSTRIKVKGKNKRETTATSTRRISCWQSGWKPSPRRKATALTRI